jgi:hypothetical protein
MIALRRRPTATLGLNASSLLFVLGSALAVILFMMAAGRVAPPPQAYVALSAVMLGVGLLGVVFLREAAAEKLLMLYIFLMPVHFFVGGATLVSIERASFGFRMSAADLVFPALVLATVTARMSSGSPLRTRAVVPLAALVLAITFSWVQSLLFLETISAFSTGKFLGLVYLVLFAAVLIEVVRERGMWERAIDAVALSGSAFALTGMIAYIAWLAGGPTALIDHDRLTATMWWDPNIFASFMVIGFILSLMRARIADGQERWFWTACAVVTALALFFSQSRSVLGAAIIGLLFLGAAYKPSFLAAALAGVGVAAVLAWSISVWVGLPTSIGAGPWNEGRFESDTATSRLEFWRRGAALLPTEGVTGIGIGSFEQINPDVDATAETPEFARAHNTYLASILELGVTGVVALVLFAGAIIAAIRTGFRHMAPDDQWRLAGLAASLVAMLAFAVFVDALYQRHLWVLAGLILAVPQVVAAERGRRDHGAMTS